jgi:uncharacterized protein
MRAVVGLLSLAAIGAPAAWGLDCTGRWLSRADVAICADPQLLRLEVRIARRIKANAQRLSFGQYLGLRHWHALLARERSACNADRKCIAASLRAQRRFLDRLRRCVATSLVQRACLRNLLAEERRGKAAVR